MSAAQPAEGIEAQCLEAFFDAGADAAEFSDGERFKDTGDIGLADTGEAVGLLHFGGEFGNEFIGADADAAS